MFTRIGLFIIQNIKKNWLTYTLILIFFLSGVAFGALGVKSMNAQQVSTLGNGLDTFLSKIDKASFNKWTLALDIIQNNLLLIGGIYILGLTIIGVPGIMVIVFSRGFRLGFTIGFLVHAKAMKGILLVIASVIPHNLIYIPVYIISAAASVAFSVSLIRGRFGNRTLSLSGHFIKYSLVMLFLAVMVLAGGFMESYVTPSLVKAVTIYLH